MNQALTAALTPEEQQRLFAGIYDLLALQVKHYHSHYHMGDNTSVPEETAKALMESLWYTLEKVPLPWQDLGAALEQGQAVLKSQTEEAGRLLKLVRATMPEICNDSYLDTLDTLDRWLRRYDYQHFAHRAPDFLDYPLLFQTWEDRKGVDRVLCCLKGMWQENQILAALSPAALENLFQGFGPDFWGIPMNLCEQPLRNALGLHLLGKSTRALELTGGDRQVLAEKLRAMENPKESLAQAMEALCRDWDIRSRDAVEYAKLVIPGVLARMEKPHPCG